MKLRHATRHEDVMKSVCQQTV